MNKWSVYTQLQPGLKPFMIITNGDQIDYPISYKGLVLFDRPERLPQYAKTMAHKALLNYRRATQ